jgi:hypothetical protein
MTLAELEEIFSVLRISREDMAAEFRVSEKTVSRWFTKPEAITGPTVQALRAVAKCQKFFIPWRKGAVDIVDMFAEPQEKALCEATLLEMIEKMARSKG